MSGGRAALAEALIEEHHVAPLDPAQIAARGLEVEAVDARGAPTRYARRIDHPAKALRRWLAAGWITHDHERAADAWQRNGIRAGLQAMSTCSWYGGTGGGAEGLSAAILDAIRWRRALHLPPDVVGRLDAVWVRREAPWITGGGRQRMEAYDRCCDDLRLLWSRMR